MRYRIYYKQDGVPEGDWPVREVEADGIIHRICDDHRHVVFGDPWPPRPIVFDTLKGREPAHYN